jgi:hypothetical protein
MITATTLVTTPCSNDNNTNDSNSECSTHDNGLGTSSTSSSICDHSCMYDPGSSKFSNNNTGDGPRRNNDDANTDKSIVQLTEVNTDPTITPSPSMSRPSPRCRVAQTVYCPLGIIVVVVLALSPS